MLVSFGNGINLRREEVLGWLYLILRGRVTPPRMMTVIPNSTIRQPTRNQNC